MSTITYIFFCKQNQPNVINPRRIKSHFHKGLAQNEAPALRKRIILFAGTKAEIWNSALVSTCFYFAGNPFNVGAYVNAK